MSDTTLDWFMLKKSSEALKVDLVKTFGKYGVWIDITDLKFQKPWLIFTLALKKNTREKQVWDFAPDVKRRLNINRLIVFESEHKICIGITNRIMYVHLTGLLQKYYTKLKALCLPYPIGFGIFIEPIMIDLSQAPHLLMGGATGSGKSVALQMLIASIAHVKTPDEVNLVLIDTGANDLMYFDGLSHLTCPIVQSQEGAIWILTASVTEMERRIKLEHTNPNKYNRLTRIVIVIDEFPALFMGLDSKKKKVLSDAVSALLQRGRHGRFHLVLGAQNPTAQQMRVEIGNITTRIAFRCAKKNYSEIILGEAGAENLTGKGELLLKTPQFDGTEWMQGVYATPDELRQIVWEIKSRYGTNEDTVKSIVSNETLNLADEMDKAGIRSIPPITGKASAEDHMLARMMLWALGQDSISVNRVMDQFHFGWNKASRLVAKLEELGIVDKLDAKLPRSVVPTKIDDLPSEMLDFLQRNGIAGETVCQALAARDTAPYSKP